MYSDFHNDIEADYLAWRKKTRRQWRISLAIFAVGFVSFFIMYAFCWYAILTR